MQDTFRILLVEDDEIDQMSFKRYLKDTKIAHHVTCIYDGGSVLQEATNEYDCIFMDYMLPGTDGLALLKKLLDVLVIHLLPPYIIFDSYLIFFSVHLFRSQA